MNKIIHINRERIIKLINKYYFFIDSKSNISTLFKNKDLNALNSKNFELIDDFELENIFIILQEAYWKHIEEDDNKTKIA